MEEEYLVTGPVRTVTVERCLPERTLFGLKEGERQFLGRLSLDGEGRPLELKDASGGVRWVYNGTGELLREERYGADGQPSLVLEYYREPERGLVCEKSGERLTVRKLGPAGEPVREQRFHGEKLEMVTEITPTPDGKPAVRESREADGRFLRRETFEYDNKGRLLRRRCLGESGALLSHDLFEYPVEHGGNWIKRIRYTVREEGNRIKEIPVEILYRNLIGDTPSGETDDGEGVLTFPDGTYRGNLRGGQMHGRGILDFSDGSRYEGDFVNGVMEGRGVFLWPDGRRYEGEFREGRIEGNGICLWPNGDSYTGQFAAGMMHGRGCFTWQSGVRFTGLFEKNQRTDQGLIDPETKE